MAGLNELDFSEEMTIRYGVTASTGYHLQLVGDRQLIYCNRCSFIQL